MHREARVEILLNNPQLHEIIHSKADEVTSGFSLALTKVGLVEGEYVDSLHIELQRRLSAIALMCQLRQKRLEENDTDFLEKDYQEIKELASPTYVPPYFRVTEKPEREAMLKSIRTYANTLASVLLPKYLAKSSLDIPPSNLGSAGFGDELDHNDKEYRGEEFPFADSPYSKEVLEAEGDKIIAWMNDEKSPCEFADLISFKEKIDTRLTDVMEEILRREHNQTLQSSPELKIFEILLRGVSANLERRIGASIKKKELEIENAQYKNIAKLEVGLANKVEGLSGRQLDWHYGNKLLPAFTQVDDELKSRKAGNAPAENWSKIPETHLQMHRDKLQSLMRRSEEKYRAEGLHLRGEKVTEPENAKEISVANASNDAAVMSLNSKIDISSLTGTFGKWARKTAASVAAAFTMATATLLTPAQAEPAQAPISNDNNGDVPNRLVSVTKRLFALAKEYRLPAKDSRFPVLDSEIVVLNSEVPPPPTNG